MFHSKLDYLKKKEKRPRRSCLVKKIEIVDATSRRRRRRRKVETKGIVYK
jgi:hypothetical protein